MPPSKKMAKVATTTTTTKKKATTMNKKKRPAAAAPAVAEKDSENQSKRQRLESNNNNNKSSVAAAAVVVAAKTSGGGSGDGVVVGGVPKGRGYKLCEIPALKVAIEKIPTTQEDLVLAYTFVFGARVGKVTKKEMKEKLLEFNGYLPALPKGKIDDDAMDKEEDKYEAKYATRAYKLNIAQIRKLCKFFHIDIHGEDGKKPLNKDETVDKLLDFLGEPDGGLTSDPLSSSLSSKNETKKAVVKKTKAATKTPTVTAKKKPATATKAKASPKKPPAEDPFVALKKHTKGEKPSDKVLRQWAKAYVLCFDIDQATTKHAIMTASDKFGVNLAPHKAKIKDMLADEM